MVCSSLWSQLLFDPQRNDFSRLSNESTQSRHETPVWRPLWLLGELKSHSEQLQTFGASY